MPTYSADWTEAQEYHASATLNAGATSDDNIDVDNAGYYAIRATVDIDLTGSPTGPITVEVFHSTDDGSLYDTEPDQKFVAMQFTGSAARKRRSFVIPTTGRVKIKVTNGTAVNATFIGKYAGLKQAS